jgi:phage gpG-like protein
VSNDTIEINNKNLLKLIKALGITRVPVARVGVLGDKNARSGAANSNATVGARHEFGSETMPKRSFLRMPLTNEFNKMMKKSRAFGKDALASVVRLGSIVPWMEKIGIIGVSTVLEAFNTGGFGQWKPSDMKRKKVHMTLVETQQLRESITSDVKV